MAAVAISNNKGRLEEDPNDAPPKIYRPYDDIANANRERWIDGPREVERRFDWIRIAGR